MPERPVSPEVKNPMQKAGEAFKDLADSKRAGEGLDTTKLFNATLLLDEMRGQLPEKHQDILDRNLPKFSQIIAVRDAVEIQAAAHLNSGESDEVAKALHLADLYGLHDTFTIRNIREQYEQKYGSARFSPVSLRPIEDTGKVPANTESLGIPSIDEPTEIDRLLSDTDQLPLDTPAYFDDDQANRFPPEMLARMHEVAGDLILDKNDLEGRTTPLMVELHKLGEQFGISDDEITTEVLRLVKGSEKTPESINFGGAEAESESKIPYPKGTLIGIPSEPYIIGQVVYSGNINDRIRPGTKYERYTYEGYEIVDKFGIPHSLPRESARAVSEWSELSPLDSVDAQVAGNLNDFVYDRNSPVGNPDVTYFGDMTNREIAFQRGCEFITFPSVSDADLSQDQARQLYQDFITFLNRPQKDFDKLFSTNTIDPLKDWYLVFGDMLHKFSQSKEAVLIASLDKDEKVEVAKVFGQLIISAWGVETKNGTSLYDYFERHPTLGLVHPAQEIEEEYVDPEIERRKKVINDTVTNLARAKPEIVARLLKDWIKEGEG